MKTRLILRFGELVEPPSPGGEEEWFQDQLADSLVDRTGVLVRRLFESLRSERLELLARRARRRDRRPAGGPVDLRLYLILDCPESVDVQALLKAFLDLKAERIPLAYQELGNGFSFLGSSADVIADLDQSYRAAAPLGIDSIYAGQFPGGDGAGLRFVDVERGWNLDHEDLIDAGITVVSGQQSKEELNHGTAVLGIVTAAKNGRGVDGIVPGLASARVVAVQRTDDVNSIADAILSAIPELRFGDVLLIEMEIRNTTSSNRPVEVEGAIFDAMRLATALGIVVIQPAGNGGKQQAGRDLGDLDLLTIDDRGVPRSRLQRGHPDFLDSGAILVGAAKRDPHFRLPQSNFGSRVDCYAWGEDILTTFDTSELAALDLAVLNLQEELEARWGGLLTTRKLRSFLDTIEPPINLTHATGRFDGTSGASAIVAGAALSVQGLAQAHLGFRFSPWQLRLILSDPAYGTPSADSEAFPIGVMPNLRAILNHVFRRPDSAAPKDGLGPASRKGSVEGELLQPDGASTKENGHLLLPFVVSGSAQRPKEMWVEVIARLPRRARVWLEMPPALADLEGIWGDPEVERLNEEENVYVPVNPHGRHPFREAILREGQRETLRLVILFPAGLQKKKSYRIGVRLLHDLKKREEVGRITWRVSP